MTLIHQKLPQQIYFFLQNHSTDFKVKYVIWNDFG